MLFNTASFGLFFAFVWLSYWSFRRHQRLRHAVLLVASYYFYASWDPRFLVLIAGVTLLDYVAGLLFERIQEVWVRQVVLCVVVGINLGILGFWKYSSFAIEMLEPLLSWVGLGQRLQGFSVLLPVGVSFFVFQGLSYVVDVYRNQGPSERSLFRFSLYISFFPQLVAGPIVRAPDLLFQLDKEPRLCSVDFGRGLGLMLIGLSKKIVLADYLAAQCVDRVFDLPTQFGTAEVVVAVYGYALQIYGDFSGYTDVAIGSALLLGFSLPRNFNSPYVAASFRDFWRRWHISLSSWLRDYLYISLGGGRQGRWRLYRNLLITMLLGGLWHGASLNFLLWGGAHGCLLVAERLWSKGKQARPTMLRRLFTFHAVVLLWVVFRAESLSAARTIYQRLLLFSPGVANVSWSSVLLIALGMGCQFVPRKKYDWALGRFAAWPAVVQAAISISVFYLLRFFASAQPKAFIYFQF